MRTAGTVLIVSRDPGDLAAARAALEGEGHRVLAMPGGTGVAGLIATAAVDCLLLEADSPHAEGIAACRAFKADPFTSVPVIVVGAAPDRSTRVAAYEAGADDFAPRPLDLDMLVVRVGSLIAHRRASAHLEDADKVLGALAQAVEMHDAYTRGHLERLRRSSGLVASTLGLSRAEIEAVRTAGVLHDVGKIGVDSSILRKNGPLSPPELLEMRLHPVYGETVVEPLRLGPLIAPMVRGHHERWDGTGYPDRLGGDAIPVGARIISVVDAYDAMTTDRPYRRAMDRATARAHLEVAARSQFDPSVVSAFLSLPSRELEG